MYLSFAPINEDACLATAKDPETHRQYLEFIAANLDYKCISSPAQYFFERQFFNNSDYHLGITGAAMRTSYLIADLKAELISAGIWEEELSNDGQ